MRPIQNPCMVYNYTYIWLIFDAFHVGEYTVSSHGSYGFGKLPSTMKSINTCLVPKNADPSREFVGLTVKKSLLPQNGTGEIPNS